MTKAQANQASIWAFVISTVRREMKATVIFQRNEVIMISRNVIRRSLQTLAPVMFLLLCSSISAFAESPSKPQEQIRNPKRQGLGKVSQFPFKTFYRRPPLLLWENRWA